MIYNHIPLDQEWKLPMLHELLKVKDDDFVLNNFVDNEITTMINRLETIFIYLISILVMKLTSKVL